jgi:hypothetical protein
VSPKIELIFNLHTIFGFRCGVPLLLGSHPAPRVINTDEHAGYPPAIVRLKSVGTLEKNCRHRPVQYLNNVLEQDHRAIKRRVRASQHFRSFWGAWRTIAGYEAIHMIRKGQACGSVVYCTTSFSVWGDELKCRSSTRPLARLQSCNASFDWICCG